MAVTINGTTGVAVPLGTAGAPGVVNTTSATTGIYNPTSTTLGLSTNGTNAVYIDASQNVGIGTTSPTAKVQIYTNGAPAASGNMTTGMAIASAAGSYAINIGADATAGYTWLNSAYINSSNTASPMVFMTGASERMRIDSSGNLNIGTTGSANVRLRVRSSTTGTGNFTIYAENSTPTALFYVRDDGAFCTGAGTSSPYSATTASAANVFVDSSGILYRSTSSIRYKENVQDYSNGLADLAKLRPVTFNSKQKEGEENPDIHTYAGFIAEEVHDAGLTEFVQYNDQGQPDALAYANMVALLTKSIQELSAEVEALKAKVGA
jgi:hypothetical protein